MLKTKIDFLKFLIYLYFNDSICTTFPSCFLLFVIRKEEVYQELPWFNVTSQNAFFLISQHYFHVCVCMFSETESTSFREFIVYATLIVQTGKCEG